MLLQSVSWISSLVSGQISMPRTYMSDPTTFLKTCLIFNWYGFFFFHQIKPSDETFIKGHTNTMKESKMEVYIVGKHLAALETNERISLPMQHLIWLHSSACEVRFYYPLLSTQVRGNLSLSFPDKTSVSLTGSSRSLYQRTQTSIHRGSCIAAQP